MASPSAVPVRSSRIRPKYVIFITLGLMFLFVLWHNERFVFDRSSDDWAYFFPVRWFIVPHALAGLAALLIGPFQLSTRFRQRHLRVHRIMGRFYLVGIAIAAIMAIYLAATHQQHPQDKLWVYALAATWLITGFFSACCHSQRQHRNPPAMDDAELCFHVRLHYRENTKCFAHPRKIRKRTWLDSSACDIPLC